MTDMSRLHASVSMFKVVVAPALADNNIQYYADYNLATNAQLSASEYGYIRNQMFPRIPVRTLLTAEEMLNPDHAQIRLAQVIEYIQGYILGVDGTRRVTHTLTNPPVFIKAVSECELMALVIAKAESQATFKPEELDQMVTLMNWVCRGQVFDIASNELKVRYITPDQTRGHDSQDILRWIVYTLTGQTLLIKSPKVLNALKLAPFNARVETALYLNQFELAKSFNRNRGYYMALRRCLKYRPIINEISRQSKTKHTPLKEAAYRSFFARLDTVTVEEVRSYPTNVLFNLLNVVCVRTSPHQKDTIILRDGRAVCIDRDNRYMDKSDKITYVLGLLFDAIADRLSHLANKTVVLDPEIDCGLPVSRKQACGQYPMGTVVTPILSKGERLVTGVYWDNDSNIRDLDMSMTDLDGRRIGWNSGYAQQAIDDGIVYSGDCVSPNSTECFAVGTAVDKPNALRGNIFSGAPGGKVRVFVGVGDDPARFRHATWMDKALFAADVTMLSREFMFGVADGKSFTLTPAALRGGMVSTSEADMLQRGAVQTWTVNGLFEVLNKKYNMNINVVTEGQGDYDLSRAKHTLADLESMLFNS